MIIYTHSQNHDLKTRWRQHRLDKTLFFEIRVCGSRPCWLNLKQILRHGITETESLLYCVLRDVVRSW